MALAPWRVALAAEATTAGSLRHRTVIAQDGVPLHVVVAGDERRPALLFLHGAYQSYLSWLGQLQDRELAQRYCLVALDARGHGASGKPWNAEAYSGSRPWAADLRAVIDTLGLHDVVLVGWSFGTFVVSAYVAEYGTASLSGIVLVGGTGGLLGPPGASVPGMPDDLLDFQRRGREYAAQMTAAPLAPAATQNTVAAFLMTPPYVRRAMAGTRLDFAGVAPRIDVPVEYIGGAVHTQVTPATLADLRTRLKAFSSIEYPGAGHSPFLEQPRRFDADLERFAAKVVPAVASADPDPRVDAARRLVDRYRAAMAGGEPGATLALYADDVVLERSRSRAPVVGRETLRATEEFHAVARPRMRFVAPTFSMAGNRVAMSTRGMVEYSALFESMGLPYVVALPVQDALEIEGDRIVRMREPEFRPECQRILGHAVGATLEWLRGNRDPRTATLAPGGVSRTAGDTAQPWIDAIRDWREATGWAPEPTSLAACLASPG